MNSPSSSATIEADRVGEPLRALRRGLERAHGFALFIAIFKTAPHRDKLIAVLREAAPTLALQIVTLRPDTTDILDEVIKQLGPEIRGPIMVVGLEKALPSDAPNHPILQALNLRRPEWAQRVRQPVVLWVPSYLFSLLARATPDFLDWRSDTLDFADLEPAQLQVLQSTSWDGGLDTRMPKHARIERIRELESRVTANETSQDPVILDTVAGWLNELGLHLALLGKSRQAVACFEKALAMASENGNRHGEAAALSNLGNAYADFGDARKALEFYGQALVIARQIGNRVGEGIVLGNLGSAHYTLRDARKAIELFEQALIIAREIRDRRLEGNALGNLGSAYSALGEARKAIELFEQDRDIAREIGHHHGEGIALGNLGSAYSALGDARKAIEFYEQYRDIARRIGDQRGEGNSLWNSALALDQLGNRSQAIVRAEAALKIYEAIEDPYAAKVRAQLTKWRGQSESASEKQQQPDVSTVTLPKTARIVDEG